MVHEGEFVANHNAVNNPSILPALRLIDEAQRNNTVSSLTAADISRSVGQGGATVVSAPSVVVNTDNSEIKAALDDTRNTLVALSAQIAEGIEAKVYINGPQPSATKWRIWKSSDISSSLIPRQAVLQRAGAEAEDL